VILAVALALAALLILFAVENIWLDSLLRSRWHRLPSLVPEERSTGWLMAFGFMGLSSGLLLVCQIFLIMDRSLVSGNHFRSDNDSQFASFWEVASMRFEAASLRTELQGCSSTSTKVAVWSYCTDSLRKRRRRRERT